MSPPGIQKQAGSLIFVLGEIMEFKVADEVVPELKQVELAIPLILHSRLRRVSFKAGCTGNGQQNRFCRWPFEIREGGPPCWNE